MINKIYRISVIVMALVVFSILLTGCASDNNPKQETTPIAIQEKDEEFLTSWKAAYKPVITDTLKDCKEKYPYETNHGGYGLYDFDNDDVPELFLEVCGSTMPDNHINIYDFNGEEAVFIDSIESAHSWVYGTNRDNAFLTECCWMGESVWNIYELKNGEFVSQKLASFYPDGFGDSTEPQENPLPGMGYEIEEIKYYFLDDLSGINNLS